jgi:hypothetical protein
VLYSFILSTLIIVKSYEGTDGGVETASQMAAALGRGGREHDTVKNIYMTSYSAQKGNSELSGLCKGREGPAPGP